MNTRAERGTERVGSGKHVLVVWNEEGFRLVLTEHLKEAGFEVTAVDSGRGGLDAAGMQRFDLVVLDFGLGRGETAEGYITGFREASSGTPIVVMTNRLPEDLERDCADLQRLKQRVAGLVYVQPDRTWWAELPGRLQGYIKCEHGC